MAIQSNNANLTSTMAAKAKAFLPAANTDNMAGMRMAAPVIKTFDTLKIAKTVAEGARTEAVGASMVANAASGMTFSSGIGSRIWGTLSGGLKNFVGALKSNFAISALLSGVSNLYEMMTGKVKPMQAAGNFIADTAAYTGIGAASTTIGGMIGSLIPIPFLGTALGIAAGAGVGLLLGKFYEDKVRTSFSGQVQQGIQSMMASAKGMNSQATQPATVPPAQ
ncbi:MAG TPA: hypothetical protein V6D00_12185 [Pantanalinema sp.]